MKIFKGIPIRNECIASYFFNMFSRKLSYWFLQIITSHLPTSVWLISAQHVCLTSGHLVITIYAYHYNCRPVKWSVHLQLAYVPHWHFCKTCRIMFTSHVSELTVNTCCWCDICSNICKHETIRYFYLTSGQFPATFAVTEPGQPEHYLSVFFCGDIQSTSTVRAAEIDCRHLFSWLCRVDPEPFDWKNAAFKNPATFDFSTWFMFFNHVKRIHQHLHQ